MTLKIDEVNLQSEVHLVLCRNVLIYFNKNLQDRVLRLFHDSLVHGGGLALGSKESLQFMQVVMGQRVTIFSITLLHGEKYNRRHISQVTNITSASGPGAGQLRHIEVVL